MNLNDFVVLPNNKARSLRLNARNLRELQTETVTLALESKDMEEKLQQLKETMSKEKAERGHSAGFKWKSGHHGSLHSNALTSSAKKDKEKILQKLSAGKVKIRMLKDEPLRVPPQPPPLPPTNALQTTRKNRLRGTVCGQCEVKTAGLSCVECTENYCVGCFARFHQKGALKLHRMIPIQTELRTLVSTRDVVSYRPSTVTSPDTNSKPSPSPSPSPSPASCASTSPGEESPGKGSEAVAKPTSQASVVNHTEEENFQSGFESSKGEDEEGSSLLSGEYDEEESARSFQEALRQWRGEAGDGAGGPVSEEAMWRPLRPASVSAAATQSDPPPDRQAGGGGSAGGPRRVPVRVEFTQNNLTYMDRLLLKKYRRTPIEAYAPLLTLCPDSKCPPETNTEEEVTLTAQEEDLHRYCVSLFAVPVSKGETPAPVITPNPCLNIDVQDETDRDVNDVSGEQRTNKSSRFPSVTQTPVLPATTTSQESMRSSRSAHSPTQPSRQPRAPPMSEGESSVNISSPSNSVSSLCPSAETTRTLQTSIETPASKSQRSSRVPTVHKSKQDNESPRRLSTSPLSHDETPKFSSSPRQLQPDLSPQASSTSSLSPSPAVPVSLRTTFTVSPSSSADSLSPRLYHSTPLQRGSQSPLLPEQLRSPNFLPQPISSAKLSQSLASNPEPPKQSHHSLREPASFLSDSRPPPPKSSGPKSPTPIQSHTSPVPAGVSANPRTSASLLNESLPEVNSRYESVPTYGDVPVFISPTSIFGSHESDLSHQSTQSLPSLSSHPLNVTQNPPFAVETEDEEQSLDSADEMSSDSLGLASYEEEDSDQEMETRGCFLSGRSSEGERGDPAVSHTDDDTGNDLQTEAPEWLSEPSRVMHTWEPVCDQERLSAHGLDLNSSHPDAPKNTNNDPLRQTSPCDSDPTGSGFCGAISRLSNHTGTHLVLKMMDNCRQPSEIQIRSTATSRRGQISADEPGTSASKMPSESASTLRHVPSPTPSPWSLAGPASLSFSRSPSPPLADSLSPHSFRPLSRAAQEITEISGLDPTGCEDPDLDDDTAAYALRRLEQELQLMAKETGLQAAVSGLVNSGRQAQHGNEPLSRARVTSEQREAEEAAERDRQSVLSLP